MKTILKWTLALVVFCQFTAQAQDKIIAVTDLPAKAQQTLKQHFGTTTATLVKSDTDYLVVKDYEVLLDNGTEIEFNSKGEWTEIKTPGSAVPAALIPNGISQYVTKAFPNTKIIKIEKERTGYEIKLNNGIEVDFNSDGQFLRIDH